MEEITKRLTDAAAALATLDEAVAVASRSVVERDSAVLRLVYTFEAVWQACQYLLKEQEKIATRTVHQTIQAAHRIGWLSDDEVEAINKISHHRNLAAHSCRDEIGNEIEAQLALHRSCYIAGSTVCKRARAFEMTRLRKQLAAATAALEAFDEALPRASCSAIERDSAILRLIYSYHTVWKACQRLLAERDNIEIGSPIDAIRAARRLGWLSDEDAEAAMKIGGDCNLATQMYRAQIGAEIKRRLPAHSAVLHRWLDALREKAFDIEAFLPSETYRLFEQAMVERKQIHCLYEGYARELCPILLGHSRGEEKALTYQFGGQSRSRLPPGGEWKCLWLFKVSNIQLRDGPWYSGTSHMQAQTCVETVDLDVNPDSRYSPKRRLEPSPPLRPSRQRSRAGLSTEAGPDRRSGNRKQ